MTKKRSLDTICIQGGWEPKNGEPRQLPICQSTTFKYTSSEQMGRLSLFRIFLYKAGEPYQ